MLAGVTEPRLAPRVSVVMPVRDGERHLEEAVESILCQTLADLELIVVDDGSRDRTPSILAGLARRDPRVRVHTLDQWSGMSVALNTGLGLARGAYLARMDADDVSEPERLAVQVAFLERHPQVGVCGSWVRVLGTPAVWAYPVDDADVRAGLLFGTPFAHPTVVMRRAFLAGGLRYDAELRQYAEDYDLWLRGAQLRFAYANVPKPLLRYRLHPGQQTAELARRGGVEPVRARFLAELGLQPTAAEWELDVFTCGLLPIPDLTSLRACGAWVERLLAANDAAGRFARAAARRQAAARWYVMCAGAAEGGVASFWPFLRSPLGARAGLAPPKLAARWLRALGARAWRMASAPPP
jgi:hypothetical protein